MIAAVAVEKTALHFDKLFDYRVTDEHTAVLQPGMRVLIPFGASNSRRQGMVLAVSDNDLSE